MTDPAAGAGTEVRAPSRWRVRAGLWSWLLAGVLVALLGTLLLVKVVGGAANLPTITSLSPATARIRAEVTGVTAAVYNAVGVTSPVVPVVAPEVLRAAGTEGAKRPFVLFVGAEYCSFCAAERWPLIAALSRFGHFGTLYDVESSPIDFAADTPSFSFYGTSYRSKLIVFHAYEVRSDVLGASGYLPLMRLGRSVRALVHRFDPSMTYPFVDIDNEFLVPVAELSPVTFAATTREQVAADLADPTNPVTQGIVASANYLTAAICAVDRQRPAVVCEAPGTLDADAALGLRR
jgi:hypothetical protein